MTVLQTKVFRIWLLGKPIERSSWESRTNLKSQPRNVVAVETVVAPGVVAHHRTVVGLELVVVPVSVVHLGLAVEVMVQVDGVVAWLVIPGEHLLR